MVVELGNLRLDGKGYQAIVIDLPIAQHRLRNQRLIGPPFQKPEDVVRWLTAVQCQDYAGAKWAIAQRVKGTADVEIDQLFNNGKILRTHVMRPTWHFVTPQDIVWMLKLTAPRVMQLMAHYNRKLELDREKVNVNGGAIALGHPIGATGAMLVGTVLDELERRDLKRGLATMCTGGGMAPAIIIERV